MGQPWLSVVLPTYDAGDYLDRALGSIAEEGDRGIECVVTDDGSTDGTVDRARRFRDRLNLRILEGPRHRSWTINTNFGIEHSTGSYVCFLHQDDCWLSGRTRWLRAASARAPQAALFVHDAAFMDASGQRVGTWRCPLRPGLNPGEFVHQRLLVQNFMAVGSPTLPRRVLTELGGLDRSLSYTADWDLWLRATERGPVFYEPAVLAAFRIHSRAQTVHASADLAGFRSAQEQVLQRHLSCPFGQRAAQSTKRAASLSIAVNVTLAAAMHRQKLPAAALLRAAARAGVRGWLRYLHSSRIHERSAARLRAELHRSRQSG
jgi:hypothetical protein